MKKQARALEQQFLAIEEEKKNKFFEADSGNGLVSVVMDGSKKLVKLSIKPDCVDPNDIEGLQDLIIEAYNKVLVKVEAEYDSSSQLLGSGFGF